MTNDATLLPMPAHVAVIMDGNGRWASERGLKRAEGHKAGASAMIEMATKALELGIKYLTVYAFSTENWKRSPDEISALMSILTDFLDNRLPELAEKGVRLRCIGQIERLPYLVRRKLLAAMDATQNNTTGTLSLAISYGSRTELTDAVRKIAEKVKKGELSPAKIDETVIAAHLYASDIPDPDLLIRTSGEMRVSNFLLWQIAYSEIYVSDVLWPDFTPALFEQAVDAYRRRNRRFGGR